MKLSNEFLLKYLEYTDKTESPYLYHIWCCISGIGACLGRRVGLEFGIKPMYPNQYVLLVGPPATRKGTAIEWLTYRLKETRINFAPHDTSGQRQGLISAMLQTSAIEDKDSIPLEELEEIDDIVDTSDGRDEQVLYAVAEEMRSLTGTNASDLVTFLTRAWDSNPYKYQLKKEVIILQNPTLSILGATTSRDLTDALPSNAIGQGYTSRIILVYSGKKRQRVWPPPGPDEKLADMIDDNFRWLNVEADGIIHMNRKANDFLGTIYDTQEFITDPRFAHYCQRRLTHVIKASICLALGERRYEIKLDDVEQAHRILQITERYMPDALGEFGLSPLADAKQKLLDFLHHCNRPINRAVLWAIMQRDMRSIDFANTLHDFIVSGKIARINHINEGELYVIIDQDKSADNEVGDLMGDMDILEVMNEQEAVSL